MTGKRSSQRGVTLVELLIALLVFALISSVGVYALRLTVDGREQLVRVDERLREWQLARLIIRQDLVQISTRIIRDEFGDPLSGSIVGGFGFSDRRPVAGETPLIGFVRDGLENIGEDIPRSTLQYVEYIEKDGSLIRRTRPFLDQARGQATIDRVLFENVEDVELSFLAGQNNRGLNWVEDWPSPDGSGTPQALRLIMVSERLGEVEQLFWIGELANQPSQPSEAIQ